MFGIYEENATGTNLLGIDIELDQVRLSELVPSDYKNWRESDYGPDQNGVGGQRRGYWKCFDVRQRHKFRHIEALSGGIPSLVEQTKGKVVLVFVSAIIQKKPEVSTRIDPGPRGCPRLREPDWHQCSHYRCQPDTLN